MNAPAVFGELEKLKIVPVIAIDMLADAGPLAEALLAGGLPVAEITFRTAAAAEVIASIAAKYPSVLVGAGTLLTVDNVKRAADCGARFGVSPGLNRLVVEEALRLNFPLAPGVMTPSEIEAGLSLGMTVLKFFPAGTAGGVPMLRSLSAPYAHTGVRFIPTGGVSVDNMRDYLAIASVLAVGGTWIASREDIAGGKWQAIRDKCASARALADKKAA